MLFSRKQRSVGIWVIPEIVRMRFRQVRLAYHVSLLWMFLLGNLIHLLLDVLQIAKNLLHFLVPTQLDFLCKLYTQVYHDLVRLLHDRLDQLVCPFVRTLEILFCGWKLSLVTVKFGIQRAACISSLIGLLSGLSFKILKFETVVVKVDSTLFTLSGKSFKLLHWVNDHADNSV